MKLAISLLTCDRMELVEQSAKPLRAAASAPDVRCHWFIVDGSQHESSEKRLFEIAYPTANFRQNVRGGAGAAIVYALTMMLQHQENYSHVGLCEADVCLLDGWLDCLELFSRGEADGLAVGAVSPRCYVDRVLFQRDGYAVMHNLGAGCIILTRSAAEIVLRTFRTAWSSDNRRIFCQLAGIDIGSYWAFRGNEHYLTADWHWDAALAAHGLASLALTPSPVEMIGQSPPLAEQGLALAQEAVAERCNDAGFALFAATTAAIRNGDAVCSVETQFHFNANDGAWTHFPHQMALLSGVYSGDWRLVERRGWGTFGWEAADEYAHTQIGLIKGEGLVSERQKPSLVVPIFGSCVVLVSGGKTGGKIEVTDAQSGFKATPELPPEGDTGTVLQMLVPGVINYRPIRIIALTPGVVFYGIQTRERQPIRPNVLFDHATLPLP